MWTQMVFKWQDIIKEKQPSLHTVVCFQMNINASGLNYLKNWKKQITSFWKTTFTFNGAVSHCVLYYQQLSNTRHQVSLYANNSY